MAPHLSVRFVRRAARQVREAVSWWEENRPAAPGAIGDSVARAVDLIRANPAIGARATNVKLRGVRRVHLSRVRYHLYYRVRADRDEIEVLAFWHTSRGSAPSL